jgi:hypothetical protein
MKQGKARFEFQLAKIETLVQTANTQENPALWLFLNDMRTPFFMLEGLAKLYAKFHNEKPFTKLKEAFKMLEDALGAIDYYAAFAKEFATNPIIPTSITAFLDQKAQEKVKVLNTILKKEGWLDGKAVKKIRSTLEKLDWLDEEQETNLLSSFYKKQIQKNEEFVQETGFVFDNVEEDVHELRRRLRWLSIYPQALQGAVKLKKTSPTPSHLKKYLTPEIINSVFNKFPVSDTQSHFLVLNESYFLSLSWLISALGKLKDKGLKIEALQQALKETALLNDTVALSEAYKLLGADYPKMDTLLVEASTMVKQYFEENNLKYLMV